jgi:RNA polymerase sigma factor (TIGR02999 family)
MTGEITQILQRLEGGDENARSLLISSLYPELRRIAEGRMRNERSDHTLQPTALVNEFFLQMARQAPLSFRNRAHFLAAASQAMRRLLIDYARSRRTRKRGGNSLRVHLDDFLAPLDGPGVDMIELDDLLNKLAQEEPRMARVVERTAKRDWQIARAWLFGRLRRADPNVGG